MKKIGEGTKFRKSNRIAVTFDSISIIESNSNRIIDYRNIISYWGREILPAASRENVIQ
jgi:hypothetical protein